MDIPSRICDEQLQGADLVLLSFIRKNWHFLMNDLFHYWHFSKIAIAEVFFLNHYSSIYYLNIQQIFFLISYFFFF